MSQTTRACAARAGRKSARARPRTISRAPRSAPTRRPTRSPTSSAAPELELTPGVTAAWPPASRSGRAVTNLRSVTAQPDQARQLVGIRVLEAQPDLAQGLDDEQAALARRHAVAVLDSVPQGAWDPASRYEESPAAIGLLVIDGVIARDIRIGGRWCSELLGPGDLLRRWDYVDGTESVASDSAWTVLDPARVAVLDERFARVI